ncbi:hypothetical protein [Thermus scotoductus]|uniref:hypothetical protein n=1 Tax=Thermus scotoductus TaxID=37636 RepID=UPI00036EB7E0|nr:hypothetical protein [Thermus scotoductus]
MKRLAWLGLLFLLAACSGYTVTTLRLELHTFVPEANRSGSLDVISGTLRFPDDDGDNTFGNDPDGYWLSLTDTRDVLERAEFLARVRLVHQSGGPVNVGLEVHVAPEGDSNIYDGNGDYRVLNDSKSLNPGETAELAPSATLAPGDPAFDLLRGGRFRVGVLLSVTGSGTIQYSLEEATLVLSGKVFGLIPNN